MQTEVFLSLAVDESIWLISALIFLCFQSGIYLFVFNSLKQGQKACIRSNCAPVSIVICARNAKKHLEHGLKAFLQQDYPEFELILVDDDSSDGTEVWIKNIQHDFSNLRYVPNPKTGQGKKQALSLGISKARYSWIALSDADCRPATPNWLQRMMSKAGESKNIVLGFAPYEPQSSLLNTFIRFESVLNALQYFSGAKLGFPYMGVGRNLVYHRAIFDQKALIPELPYGDDDLLISAKASRENTAICLHPEAFVYSAPATSYTEYFQQKWRHYAASHQYRPIIKAYLFMYFLSLLGFYFSFMLLLIHGFYWMAMGVLSLLFLSCWPVFCKKAGLLKEKGLCLYFPILQVLYVIHLVCQLPYLWIKKKSW